MFKNKILYLTKIAPYCFLLIISFAPFIWGYDISQYQYIGGGDFISLINVKKTIIERLFVYNPFAASGMDVSFLSAHLFPFYVFYWLLSLFNLSPLVISLLFISAIIFIAEICMYKFVIYSLKEKVFLNSKYTNLLALFGGILYGFSPFLVSLIHPGHILLLLSYSLFPLLLKHYDLLLSEEKIIPVRLLYLFLILLLCASAFANIGIFYALIIVLFSYTFFSYIIYAFPLKRGLTRCIILILLAIGANAWWMLPFFMTLGSAIALNEASSTITASIGQATEKASIVNIFLGKAEYLFYTHQLFHKYLSTPYTFLFSIFLIFFSISLVKMRRYKYLLVIFLLLLLGIFITKGDKGPFQEIFLWMYNHIPGFQIFRRPVSKFYWVFFFSYLTIVIIGAALMEDRFKKKFRSIWFFALTYIFIISTFVFTNFIRTPALKVFNIPEYYSSAEKMLLAENVNKLLILPSIYGQQPVYNKSVNYYGGSDFLDYIWRFSTISPDPTNYSLELPYKKPTNNLMPLIRSNKPICQATKDLGITHIMVREDLWEKKATPDKPEKLISILDEHNDITSKQSFFDKNYKGFTIYSLRKECGSKIIELKGDKASEIKYFIVNPSKITITIRNISQPLELSYLNNFSKSWRIYSMDNPPEYAFARNTNVLSNKINFYEGEELSYVWKKSLFEKTHTMDNAFANSWIIDPASIKANKLPYTQNSDRSINVNLVLFYWPQSYFYYGIIISVVAFLGIIALALNNFYQKRRP